MKDLANKSISAKLAIVGALLAVIAAVFELIYGVMYEQYADFVVVLCLLVGGALWIAYALVDRGVTEWFCLLGVFVAGFGMGLFLTNSYNVWADTWGNILQYGSLTGEFNFFNSQGGPIPAVVEIVLCLAAAICGTISCFHGKETSK